MKTLNFFALVSIFVTFVNCNEVPSSLLIDKEALTIINPSFLNNINIFSEDNTKAKRANIKGVESDPNAIACKKEQNDFSDCFGNDGSTEFCDAISKERCIKFFKDPAADLPSCEKYDHSVAQELSISFKYMGSINQLVCANNGNCTMAKQLIENVKTGKSKGKLQPSDIDAVSEEALNSDCSHKDCIEAAIYMYETQREMVDVLLKVSKEKDKDFTQTEEKKKGTNELLSMTNKNLELLYSCSQKSGTVKIIVSNVLLISIITVFIIFLIK